MGSMGSIPIPSSTIGVIMNNLMGSIILSTSILISACLITFSLDNVKIDVEMICKPESHCVMEQK